jgi:hypothetical protein
MRFRHGRVGLPSRKANMSYDVTYSAQGKESAILVAMVALALVSLATARLRSGHRSPCSDSRQRGDSMVGRLEVR